MAASAVQRLYRTHSYLYDKTRWITLHGRRRAVEQLRLGRDSSVLEVGCGTGLNFRHLLAPLDADRGNLVGLDFSEPMLRVASKRVETRGWKNVGLVVADATKLQFGTSFDGVLFGYSLTMIPDWEKSLEQAKECLAPGGRLVVLDFSTFDGWGPFGAVMRGWLKHYHVHTRRPYVDKLRELFPDLKVDYWLGGYNFTAVGVKA